MLRGAKETRIPIEKLSVGDQFVVRPGEKITDGVVELAPQVVDLPTHRESVPVEVREGDDVVAVGELGWATGRPRDPGGRRHPARADGEAGRGRSVGQGRGAGSLIAFPASSCRW